MQLTQSIRKFDKISLILFWNPMLLKLYDYDIEELRRDISDQWGILTTSLNDLERLFLTPGLPPPTIKRKPLVIAISGCSHSGKSTLANHLNDHFQKLHLNVKSLHQDNYFFFPGVRYDSLDHPSALNHFKWRNDIEKSILNTDLHILIVEGFMAYFDPFLTCQFDIK